MVNNESGLKEIAIQQMFENQRRISCLFAYRKYHDALLESSRSLDCLLL